MIFCLLYALKHQRHPLDWKKWPPEVQLPRSWFWAWQAGNDSTSSYKLPLLSKTQQQQQQQKRCWKELKLLFQGVTQGSLPGLFYFHFLSRVLSFTPCTSYKFSVQQEKLCWNRMLVSPGLQVILGAHWALSLLWHPKKREKENENKTPFYNFYNIFIYNVLWGIRGGRF